MVVLASTASRSLRFVVSFASESGSCEKEVREQKFFGNLERKGLE